MKAVRAWLHDADQYCFGLGSATTLGVLRILIGALAFANWGLIAFDWDAWFSERGYVPNWMGAIWFGDRTPLGLGTSIQIPRINLLDGVTDPRITITFYVIVVLSALFTSLGLWTRFSAFVLAIGTITLHHRNGVILHGGDTVLRICTIYLAVSPCGRACSLDRLIGLWRNRITHLPVRISVWPLRLFAYNVALIYFTTLWLKWDGPLWHNLTANWYPEHLAEFYRFPVPEFLRSAWIVRVTTVFTILTEFCLGTIVFFPPARRFAIVAGLTLHAYIEYSMNIPLFSFQMMSLYLAFYEGHEVSDWAERMGLRMRRWHVVVALPEGRRLSPRAVAFLDAIDPFNMVTYAPGESPAWRARTYEGRPIPVPRAIATRCPGAWIFAWIPGLLKRLLASSIEPLGAVPVPQQGYTVTVAST